MTPLALRGPLRSLVVVALWGGAVAGCGGAEGTGSALDDALSYVPKDSPFVISTSTDLDGDQAKAIEKIAERFPLAEQARKSLEQSLSVGDVDFEQDVKPALGNEFVVAGTSARSFSQGSEDDDFVAAIQAKDGEALDRLVEKSPLKEVGEASGAKLYESEDGDVSAIEGDVVVFGGSRELLEAALERHDGEDHLNENALDDATEGLPEDALVRLYFNAEELIANEPGSEDARKVKWVRALRTVGFAASFEDDAVNVDFRANTEGEELSEEDLPIAAGTASPPVIDRPGEIGVGLRDLEQILTFGEAAAQAVDPASFGDYTSGKETIERRLDVDIEDDLLAQLEDDVSMTFSIAGGFGVRAGVKDEAAFERTLDRIGPAAAKFAEGALGERVGYVKPKRSGGFYALATADGDSIVYGVKDGVLVLANDDARAGALSSAETETVEGAEGAISVRADAQQLATQIVSQLGVAGLGDAPGGALLTEPLGELTGSVSAEPEGITGSFTLKFD